MRAPWERDETFMAVAAVAWPDDCATALRKGSYGPEGSARQAARTRMKHRWEGYRHTEQVAEKLSTMQRAVDAMSAKVSRMVAAAKG
jgi:hypothetical protein